MGSVEETVRAEEEAAPTVTSVDIESIITTLSPCAELETGLKVNLKPPFVVSPVSHTFETTLEPEALSPMFSGVEWAGTQCWKASIECIKVLHERRLTLEGGTRRAIELGCGLGVPGVSLSFMYKSLQSVTLTDSPKLLDQLKRNTKSLDNVKAAALWWGEDDAFQELLSSTAPPNSDPSTGKSKPAGWDLVLCCDCIYEPLYGKSWQPLASVLMSCLDINRACVVLVACERRASDNLQAFLEIILKNGKSVTMEERGERSGTVVHLEEGVVTPLTEGEIQIYTITNQP